MTMQMPRRTIADRVLAWFGRERLIDTRGVGEAYKRFGPYVYLAPRYESFWRAGGGERKRDHSGSRKRDHLIRG